MTQDTANAATINSQETHKPLILVTGVTGYVGGRLVPRLLEAGYRVRVMSRDTRYLQGRSWVDQVEIMQGDVLEPQTLPTVMAGVDAAYYLIHSLEGSGSFEERDLQAARHFSQAAEGAHIKRVIYLGGLGEARDDLSEHLESRQKVGKVLRAYAKSVTEFRAVIVVGAGSISFEMVRYLTERVPVMITPRWVNTRIQPIAIEDVLTYLIAALKTAESAGQVIEIGGADVLTYGEMMLGYAKERKLKRVMIPVPVLSPRLSSYWVHLITPINARTVYPLIEGLKNEVIVTDDNAHKIFPDIHPLSYIGAVRQALAQLSAQQVETSWTDSTAAVWETEEPYTYVEERGMMIEQRKRDSDAPPEKLYQAFTSLGGETGWLYMNWLWRLRGWMDRAMGGVGYRQRRGSALRVGDVLDFWRVEAIEPNKMIRLRAEMKLPGRGWLQFEVAPSENGKSTLTQTAYYAPKGLFGLVYWYSIFFIHRLLFDGMIDRVVALAENDVPTQKQVRLALPIRALVVGIITPIVALGLITRVKRK